VADQTDLICRFQPDGKIPFANPAYCEFCGKPEPALLGADFFQSLVKDEARMLQENFPTLSKKRPVLNFDRKAEAVAGHVEWQQYSLRRLKRADGQGEEFQVVIQNKLAAATGCQRLFLTPYSPDLNPIKQLWAAFKTSLRKDLSAARNPFLLIVNTCQCYC